jgi:hypothetical protein
MCRLAAFFEFRAIIGSDAVDYNEADIKALDRYWDLVLQNMFLGFEVVDARALKTS